MDLGVASLARFPALARVAPVMHGRGRAMMPPDVCAAWVLRARRGETAAFEALAREFLRPAYAVALSVVRRPADAEDVAQDALLKAFEAIDSCREPGRFGAWLLQIARNHALHWLARRRLRDVSASPSADERSAVPSSADVGLRERLLAGLDELTPPQREVVLLHDLEEWTHAEISGALGITETNSRQHLFVARRALRTRLASDAPKEISR
jgi:RNA polymerase sigma-70 factor (ECF subfamily)